MRVRTTAIVALALALVVGAPAVVLARSQDPQNPELLRPDEPRTGTLPGSPAGSFAFFAVEYPGGEQEMVIRMTPRPTDPSYAERIAFNVYGPDGLIGTSTPATEGDPSVREFRYSDPDPVRLLVQLYNYTLTQTVNYTMVASGIIAPAVTPAVTPAPTPAPPEVLPEAGEVASGVLVGSRAGAFALFQVPYPGDGSDVIVEAIIAPDDPVLATAVGLNVYNPDGVLIAEGTTRATPGRRQATFASDVAGNSTIQLYNYTEGTPVSFELSW